MRTNVDIPAKHLTALRTLAARRGLRGFSKLVTEALDKYLAELRTKGEERREKAIDRLIGSVSSADAEHMRKELRKSREEKA
jgi:metal-responsive CopG/Arc/MetJ family transcriptional regulator